MGPNTPPIFVVPPRCTRNRAKSTRTLIGTTEMPERRRGDIDALDRAKDGDGGRDDAVAVEQRGTKDSERAEHHQPNFVLVLMKSLLDEREERENSTLPVVVRPHDEEDVLDRDDHRERPHDERQHAEHVLGSRKHARLRRTAGNYAKALLHRVERARSNVAVDDAKRRE